jgi:hypothetical protein
MKKFIKTAWTLIMFSLIIFSPYLLFAEEGTRVFFKVKKELYVQPDELWISINIETTGKTEAEVINSLGKADKKIRNLGLSYQGGNYQVFKNCFWKKGERVCRGFKGRAEYFFKLTSVKDQKILFETLDKKPKNYSYFINFETWKVSENKAKEIEKKLGALLFKEIFQKKNFVEKHLGKKCFIKEIKFGTRFYPFFIRSSSEGISAIPQPVKKKRLFTKEANIELLCK